MFYLYCCFLPRRSSHKTKENIVTTREQCSLWVLSVVILNYVLYVIVLPSLLVLYTFQLIGMMVWMTGPRKGILICLCVSVGVFFLTVTILLLTILKPKQPLLTSQPVLLENVVGFNVTLGITITIDNHRNYGSFHYNDSTTYIHYRGTMVGQAPMKEDTIPPRTKHNITTSVVVFANRLVLNPGFVGDLITGVFNVTSSTVLHGKVKVWKIVKKKATTNTTCDISIFIHQQIVKSVCKEKYQL